MLKKKFRKLISIVLTVALISTTLTCSAANIVPIRGGNVVVPPSAPVTKTSTNSKNLDGGFSLQAMKSKIDDIIYPQKNKAELRDPQGDCGSGIRWELNTNTGVLNITKISPSSTGNMYDYDVGNPPWYDYRDSIESVKINYGVTTIGKWAFVSCKNLYSVDIPNSVTAIGEKAFYYCSSLTSIDIPNSVTDMGAWTFEGCNVLSHVCYLGTEAPTYFDPAVFAFCPLDNVHVPSNYNGDSFCGIAVAKDGCPAVSSSSSSSGSGSCPITSGQCGGENCTWELDTDCVLHITGTGKMDNYDEHNIVPWNDYKSLITSVIIENGITSIGHHAFDACFSLTNVTIPNTVTSIGDGAFCHCSSLEAVTIPDSVTSIENGAFEACVELKSVAIRSTNVTMGSTVFANCRALSQIYYLGTSDPAGDSDFDYCVSLNDVAIPVPTGYTNDAFCGKPVSKCLTTGTCGDNAKWILNGDTHTLTVYGTGNMIHNDWNADLINSVTIEDGITAIGNLTFYNHSALTNVTIPDSVTFIGESAFNSCSSLTSITIPDSVISIEKFAFCCSALRSINIPNTVTSIGQNAFDSCGALNSITLPESVTSIEESLFYNCGSLKSVTLGKNVTSIGVNAFNGCSSLTNITISDSVTSIGESAFNGCSSLTNITIPSSMTVIEAQTFHGCSALTSVTIPNTVTSIGNNAFYDCSSLTNVTIPNSVASIGDYVFNGCSSLTNVNISSSIEIISNYAFRGCTNLQTVYVPNNVKEIYDSAFSNCTSLKNVTVAGDLDYVGPGAFAYCTALNNFTYKGKKSPGHDKSGVDVFYYCDKLRYVNVPKDYEGTDFCNHDIYPPKGDSFLSTTAGQVILAFGSALFGTIVGYILPLILPIPTVKECLQKRGYCLDSDKSGKKAPSRGRRDSSNNERDPLMRDRGSPSIHDEDSDFSFPPVSQGIVEAGSSPVAMIPPADTAEMEMRGLASSHLGKKGRQVDDAVNSSDEVVPSDVDEDSPVKKKTLTRNDANSTDGEDTPLLRK